MKKDILIQDINEMIDLIDEIETKAEALHLRLGALLNEACVMEENKK